MSTTAKRMTREDARTAVTGDDEEERVKMDRIGMKKKLYKKGGKKVPNQIGSPIATHPARAVHIPTRPSSSTTHPIPAVTRNSIPDTRHAKRKAENRSVTPLRSLRGVKKQCQK